MLDIIFSIHWNNIFNLEDQPVITILDFKEILNDPLNSSIRENKINILKNKINHIIEEGNFELEEIISPEEISSSHLSVFDCTVYFLSGYENLFNL